MKGNLNFNREWWFVVINFGVAQRDCIIILLKPVGAWSKNILTRFLRRPHCPSSMSSSSRSNGKRTAFGSITYRRLQLLGRRRRVSIFLHTYNNICLRVCTAALMKTCVQLINPVYLRMCSDECCCRAVFILYTFYLSSSSLSISPPSLSHTPSHRLSFCPPTFVFFLFVYRESHHCTLTKARRPQRNPLFISGSGGDDFYYIIAI